MSVDWGRALASGLESGANAYVGQMQNQQQTDDWLMKQERLQKINADNQRELERYRLGLKPPETRTVNDTNAKGEQVTRTEEWVPDPDKGTGTFKQIGESPNINFEKLAEQQRNNDLKNDAAVERLRLQGEANAARAEAAAARGGAAAGGERGADWVVEQVSNPDGTGGFVRVNKRTGESVPVTGADQKPISTFRGGENLAALALKKEKAEALKGTLSQIADSIGLGSIADAVPKLNAGSKPAAAAKPEAEAPAKGAAPYQEGQIIYDKTGNKYVVRNGQPVPA